MLVIQALDFFASPMAKLNYYLLAYLSGNLALCITLEL